VSQDVWAVQFSTAHKYKEKGSNTGQDTSVNEQQAAVYITDEQRGTITTQEKKAPAVVSISG
jgi:hypothetical protein